MIGRANTTLTLIIFLLIFGFQIGVGAVLSHWPASGGHYPAVAHLIGRVTRMPQPIRCATAG